MNIYKVSFFIARLDMIRKYHSFIALTEL